MNNPYILDLLIQMPPDVRAKLALCGDRSPGWGWWWGLATMDSEEEPDWHSEGLLGSVLQGAFVKFGSDVAIDDRLAWFKADNWKSKVWLPTSPLDILEVACGVAAEQGHYMPQWRADDFVFSVSWGTYRLGTREEVESVGKVTQTTPPLATPEGPSSFFRSPHERDLWTALAVLGKLCEDVDVREPKAPERKT